MTKPRLPAHRVCQVAAFAWGVSVAGLFLFGCSTRGAGDSATVGAPETSADAALPPSESSPPEAGSDSNGPCPGSAPAPGSGGCTGGPAFPICEYGNPHCPTPFSCNGGNWALYSPPQACATASGCPASFQAASDAGSCPLYDTCTYAEGRCACIGCALAGADGGTEWACEQWVVPTGCPTTEPLAGTPCTPAQAQLTCDYGWNPCGVPVLGDLLVCDHGYWSAQYEGVGVSCDGAVSVCTN
jgi:hypothetical protein